MSQASSGARIGVFVCHCGGNIADVVDVHHVAEEVGKLPGVVLATTHMFVCSDPGQALVESSIKEHGLNRVIVAACSPTLHQMTFRRAIERAGLNQFLFEHVNVREQVSWVTEDPVGATAKATRLVTAAVQRAHHLTALDKRRIAIEPAALVIGGGVAGMVAARDLAQRNMKVTLVESRSFLGGRMAQLDTVFPTGEKARDLLQPLIQDVVSHPLIRVITNGQVIGSEGVVGDFRTRVRITPRGVNERLAFRGNAIAACPEETVNEFDFGLSKRKAIYMAYPGCWPPMPAIDWHTCTKCGKCVWAVGGKGIELDEEPHEVEVRTGVIVLATGYDPYEPLYGEYGYGIFPRVVTLQQLIRYLDPEGPTGGQLPLDGARRPRIGFIYCVGARQIEGVNQRQPDGKVKDYCARTCCTGALHAALTIKGHHPDATIYNLYQDIRTYGRGHEEFYERASEAGALFIRFDPHHPPRVEKNPRGDSPLLVRVQDLLTDRLDIELPLDLLVLATGVNPHDISELVGMYRCAVGYDSFLLEVHPKLRPVELAVSGVFLAGCCQGPMDITEACGAASAAASKAAALIAQGQVEMDPFTARVNEELCTGCQTCLLVCPYGAITRDIAKRIANVNQALCTGCGTCAAACPSNAIQQAGFTDSQVLSEVYALLADRSGAVTA
ncbi:MAG TPA: CoB--CoM heterodisulfide reductase iron-sulfur subunit A family protein [Thermoanaerobaculales bacterium]|nr:CoB--CoM heterodisulfide reductase iron-sulfur subunit A family protein [Thermoanaerobaculales bacterium]HPA81582.1 CoB--CoM heterodisulfide reductase iron-sulfur subunit A family protein [Thermoanaerobaculales bacterium]HQL30108.1 CoB--CoM heterodisulfide reductase iron-sulfur subunit A family protein [Thermoanaerobaculales bacterium]HQN94793.1 CoB--CoM heterodisulfide reductase iron-sulfur subunit A family protein [Thermoanaerobaculales bacterium]HQP43169.1 CoB--CoM heterodisulfide reducta